MRKTDTHITAPSQGVGDAGPASASAAQGTPAMRGFSSWLKRLNEPLVWAGLVLGLGFGGFADGIVLHQILGWHHLVCVTAHCRPTSIEQLQLQNLQDGFFHLGVWLVSLVGTAMLFRAARSAGPGWAARALFGSMFAGWGLFNFVEGIIDHQILGIHHVLPGHPHQFLFDMLFLAAGVALVIIGVWLIQPPRNAPLPN